MLWYTSLCVLPLGTHLIPNQAEGVELVIKGAGLQGVKLVGLVIGISQVVRTPV